MPPKITIVVAVDTIAALSEQTPENNVFLMDDSPFTNAGKGTSRLVTSCCAGQQIEWIVRAIDLQTPVAIRGISFAAPGRSLASTPSDAAEAPADPHLDRFAWTGIVPGTMVIGQEYRYQLDIWMGAGRFGTVSIDTPALKRVLPQSPRTYST